MNRSRKLLIILAFVIVDISLVATIVFITDVTKKNILSKEIGELADYDFLSDRYNTKVKTVGDYALVEGAIKKYLDDYAVDIQRVMNYSERLDSDWLPSEVAYKNDEVKFTSSYSYIDAERSIFNSDIDKLIERTEIKEVENFIYTYTIHEDAVALYKELLNEYHVVDKVVSNKALLEKRKIEMNSYYDTVIELLGFLKNNYGSYVISNGQVVFTDDNLELQYRNLIEKTKRIE